MLESITDNKKSSTSSDISTVPRTTGYQPAPSNVEYLQLLQKLQQYEQKLAQLQENPTATSDSTNPHQPQQQQQIRRQTISAPMILPRPPPPTVTRPPPSAYVPPNFQNSDDEIFREFISQVVTTANELRAARKNNE